MSDWKAIVSIIGLIGALSSIPAFISISNNVATAVTQPEKAPESVTSAVTTYVEDQFSPDAITIAVYITLVTAFLGAIVGICAKIGFRV